MPFASLLHAAPAGLEVPLQSALDARGDAAARILDLTWVLFVGGGLIFIAVMALLVLALAGPGGVRSRLAGRSWIVGGGIAFPVVALSALLAYTFAVAADLGRARHTPAAARIQVTGELWWWRVRYLDATGATLLETANEIHLPAGQPVDLELASADVIHSFWVPSLAGKVDMIPGRVNHLRLRAHAPGTFRGQCAEYCGGQHARMALNVVAYPPEEFDAWLQARRAPANSPAEPILLRGQALFAEARCGACHAIRGTPANGSLGPDLTHVGSRLSLAAGTMPNGPDLIAAWITHSQQIKPGSRMPLYRQFAREDLQALAAYLASLR